MDGGNSARRSGRNEKDKNNRRMDAFDNNNIDITSRTVSVSSAATDRSVASRHMATPSGLVDFATDGNWDEQDKEVVGGAARDEYGFILATPGGEEHDTRNGGIAPVMRSATIKTKKKAIAFEHKRNNLWDAFLANIGGDIMKLSATARSRWRKYAGQDIHGSLIFTQEGEIPLSGSAKALSESPPPVARSRSSSIVRIGASIGASVVRKMNKMRLDLGATVHGKGILTMLIREYGVPHHRRGEVWIACSGAMEKRKHAKPNRKYYERMLRKVKQEPSPCADVIERDLHRTFPTNYHFEDDRGISMLRNVLLAYSGRNVKVGYCQSMNFLVALLLLHMDEEDAFWCLCAICEDLVPGHYTSKMTGMHIDQRVFESLLEERLPKLDAHIKKYSVPLAPITYQWFLCLFVNTLPLECTLRVWDLFLHEGTKALFRVGIAILKIQRKEIMAQHSFQGIYKALRKDLTNCIDHQKLMSACYGSTLARFHSKRILELRAVHGPAVHEELSRQAKWHDFKKHKREKESIPTDDAQPTDSKSPGPSSSTSGDACNVETVVRMRARSSSFSKIDSNLSMSPSKDGPRITSESRRLSVASDFQYSFTSASGTDVAPHKSLLDTVSSRILSGHWRAVSGSLRRTNSTGIIVVPSPDNTSSTSDDGSSPSLTPSSSKGSIASGSSAVARNERVKYLGLHKASSGELIRPLMVPSRGARSASVSSKVLSPRETQGRVRADSSDGSSTGSVPRSFASRFRSLTYVIAASRISAPIAAKEGDG